LEFTSGALSSPQERAKVRGIASSHEADARFRRKQRKEEDAMKTRVLLMTGLFALTMIAAGQVAQAQQAMLVDVPFDFVAAGTTLPAGEYRVSPQTTTGNVLLIRSQQDLNTAAMVHTNAAQANHAPANSKLVFHRYGDQYFLAQVWIAGNIRGKELPKSPAEKEIAKLAKLEEKGFVTIEARLSPTQP
jgi:hypothetical protein